jgi:hypothetical protein
VEIMEWKQFLFLGNETESQVTTTASIIPDTIKPRPLPTKAEVVFLLIFFSYYSSRK